MNPVFIFLVILAAVALWILLSFLYEPVGRFIYRIWKNTSDDADDNERED